jgi:PAS domain S-box-containing protein
MNKKPNNPFAAAELRRRAEARLRKRAAPERLKAGAGKRAVDARRLPHELQVHQVELEMQNAELREARDRMEVQLEKYTDLYDFAPVGYFSLDEQGRILEVNLAGAALLGVERSRLLNRRFPPFVVPPSQSTFLAFLEQVFAGTGKQACEAVLLRENAAAFWASLQGTCAIPVSASRKWCRMAVSDITSLKQAEAAQRRLEVLAATNQKLEQEIIRRQAVEDSLKESEQQQRQLLEQSRQMQEQLRRLSRQVLVTQEEERKRISRELHDIIAQTLTGINVHLSTLKAKAAANAEGIGEIIDRAQRLVEQSVRIVHQFARALRPAVLDDLGLIPALRAFMKSYKEETGIHVSFSTFAAVEKVSDDKRTVLYRVAQEALTNVARHARASRASVELRQLDGAISMTITDDGKGFRTKAVLSDKRKGRLGLLGMKERLEMVGGKLIINSIPGKGTTLRTEMPFGSRTVGGGAKRADPAR